MKSTLQEIHTALKKWIPIFSLPLIPFWLGSYGGEFYHALDLISSFKLQMLYGALAVFFINLVLSNWKTFLWSSLAVVCLGYEVMLWSLPYSGKSYGTQELTIYYSNVLTSNQRHDLLLKQLKQEKPDLVALLEVNRKWHHALNPIRSDFPHESIITREDNFGIALLSKFELTNIETLYLCKSRVPSVLCSVMVSKQQSIRLLITHPVPPVTSEGFMSRNCALEQMGKLISQSTSPLVVVGDLNITMWSPHYQKMMALAPNVYNARQGFGVAPTWPSSNSTKIPIDHCFLSRDLKASDFRTLESNGSDHLPIVIEILY